MNNKPVLKVSAAIFLMAAVAIPQSAAQAQHFRDFATGISDVLQVAVDMLPADVTSVRLGLGPAYHTDYEGSDHATVSAVPVISLRYRNILEVDNNEVKFTAFNQMFNSDMRVGGSALRAGPLASINFGRKPSDSYDLRGMGKVGTAFELGGFVTYVLENGARVRLRARQDVAGGHSGALVTLDLTQGFIRSDKFVLGGSISGTWASGPYMRSYFGVTPAQAVTSKYPVYTPGGALKDISLGLSANYQIAGAWTLVTGAGFEHLLGAAADSPLVRLVGSRNQLSFNTFVVYQF